MAPSVAACERNGQIGTPPTARHGLFSRAFTAHSRVSFFRVATDKTAPPQRVPAAQLVHYPFYTPPQSVGSALVIDIDRPEAVLEIFETIPAAIHPSWVIETRKGAQAGWLIDPVDLRDTAREHPIRYARAVGHALRAALAGDEAVDPLTPSRVRNPAYERAELRAAATPPVYTLGTLHQALDAADLWRHGSRLTGRSVAQAAQAATAAISEGNRNQTVFDVARHAAYRGEDHAAVAWDTNDAADVPLPAAEVLGIIRSITRYMSRTHHTATATVALPSEMREALSEMGRRGGQANTPAQRAARAQSCKAATAARTRATDARARKAQRMHTRGHTRRHICTKLGISAATLCRWLRRFIPSVSLPEHQVVRCTSPPAYQSPSRPPLHPPTSSQRPPRPPALEGSHRSTQPALAGQAPTRSAVSHQRGTSKRSHAHPSRCQQ